MIIKQCVDEQARGDTVQVVRVLRFENRLYVEVQQGLDATEPTLMRAVNRAVTQFMQLAKSRRGYGTEKRNRSI